MEKVFVTDEIKRSLPEASDVDGCTVSTVVQNTGMDISPFCGMIILPIF